MLIWHYYRLKKHATISYGFADFPYFRHEQEHKLHITVENMQLDRGNFKEIQMLLS
jgi:hypothetical protein